MNLARDGSEFLNRVVYVKSGLQAQRRVKRGRVTHSDIYHLLNIFFGSFLTPPDRLVIEQLDGGKVTPISANPLAGTEDIPCPERDLRSDRGRILKGR